MLGDAAREERDTVARRERQYAGVWVRLAALIADVVLLSAVFFPVTRIVKGTWVMTPNDHRWVRGWFVSDPLCLVFLAVMFLYFVLLEGLAGATMGKQLLGLQVVRADGSRAGLSKAVVRNVMRVVDGLPAVGIVGAILIASSDERTRAGDLVAGTRVRFVAGGATKLVLAADAPRRRWLRGQGDRSVRWRRRSRQCHSCCSRFAGSARATRWRGSWAEVTPSALVRRNRAKGWAQMATADTKVYAQPRYYELAFSFRDIPKEVDCFEECIRRFSRIPVHRVLELACGHAPHLDELARRGFAYVGVDLSAEMLEYATQRAKATGATAQFLQASMIDFTLRESVDFAFVALGSLYARSTAELNQHLDSVARALRNGGLYFLDWCIQFGEEPSAKPGGDSWRIEREGTHVRAAVMMTPVDQVQQLFEETITLAVEEQGNTRTLTTTNLKRIIYPQEFLRLIEARADFSFVGWWNNWDLASPLDDVRLGIDRPIAVLRREC